MERDYKKLFTCLLASGVILTSSGCSMRDYTDLTARNYRIKQGDTLSEISLKKYGTSEYSDELANYNNIDNPDLIFKGDVIKIPSKQNLIVYFIQEGDTLSDICYRKYKDASFELICKVATYNDLKSLDYINAGNSLLLPDLTELDSVIAYDYERSMYLGLK